MKLIILEKGNNKYFIQQYSQQQYSHGGIGYLDAERILMQEGYAPILFPHHHEFSFGAKISRFLYLFRIFFQVKRGARVVFLFPVYAKMNRLLIYLLAGKGVVFICFLADINGLKDGDERELKKEIRFLKRFRYFIVHNRNMKQWVENNLHDPGIGVIEFFDFLVNPLAAHTTPSFDIAFAGNLAKSTFLESLHELPLPLHFYLYGPGETPAMLAQPNVSWCGVETPYGLPAKLKGSFGLVWDGDAIDKPGGSLGDYMQYITHHKVSLYIISRLPLIVPSTAGSAHLVEKYRIGFCINNLFEIRERIESISESDYRQMQDNMEQLARRISTGGCLKDALEELADQGKIQGGKTGEKE